MSHCPPPPVLRRPDALPACWRRRAGDLRACARQWWRVRWRRQPVDGCADHPRRLTPLLDALERGHWLCARLLLRLGADASRPHPESRLTPLHLSVCWRQPWLFALLLARGGDLRSTAPDPFLRAKERHHQQKLTLLGHTYGPQGAATIMLMSKPPPREPDPLTPVALLLRYHSHPPALARWRAFAVAAGRRQGLDALGQPVPA